MVGQEDGVETGGTKESSVQGGDAREADEVK